MWQVKSAKSLKRSLRKVIVQGYNENIQALFDEIVEASFEEFYEDNFPTLAHFLTERLYTSFLRYTQRMVDKDVIKNKKVIDTDVKGAMIEAIEKLSSNTTRTK